MSWYPSTERRGAICIVKTMRIGEAHIYLEKQCLKKHFVWTLFNGRDELGMYLTEAAGISAWYWECEKREGLKGGVQASLF